MANPDFGYCICPLCGDDGAAVRVASNGKAYINCDGCTSNVRTLSRRGDAAIRALMTRRADGSTDNPQPKAGAGVGAEASPAAAAAAAPAPAGDAKPAAKKRGMFADALDVLGGGR